MNQTIPITQSSSIPSIAREKADSSILFLFLVLLDLRTQNVQLRVELKVVKYDQQS